MSLPLPGTFGPRESCLDAKSINVEGVGVAVIMKGVESDDLDCVVIENIFAAGEGGRAVFREPSQSRRKWHNKFLSSYPR